MTTQTQVEPQTEAGRALVKEMAQMGLPVSARVLAIEQESAASERLRLVERIKEYLHYSIGVVGPSKVGAGRWIEVKDADAALEQAVASIEAGEEARAILDAVASESDR